MKKKIKWVLGGFFCVICFLLSYLRLRTSPEDNYSDPLNPTYEELEIPESIYTLWKYHHKLLDLIAKRRLAEREAYRFDYKYITIQRINELESNYPKLKKLKRGV